MPQLTFRSNIPLVRQGLERLRAATPTIGRKRIYDATQNLLKRMKKPGKKITYPVNWDTEKQRIAFFASDGFGGGIPTKRTNRYIGGWKVEKLTDGYRIINKTPGSKYIGGLAYGTGQSRIHRDRWPLFRRQAEIVIRALPKLVVENLKRIVRDIGKSIGKI